ncbi:uncharacterized protein BJ171DRAFT_174555 [Polychytrium aggregatum]|uniref:uncharacterized protein n=1 Tax=Polychytrium aggregatum TaxID=110093 RepID=UPI0022FEEF92|nr:uncharacterized protein BJ171DRAFT_174555 [Polychytrium aggregatum]KAI9209044.1 hypothetical protein BJ171DRAFT_174555 [Polychytrium aggregatum]
MSLVQCSDQLFHLLARLSCIGVYWPDCRLPLCLNGRCGLTVAAIVEHLSPARLCAAAVQYEWSRGDKPRTNTVTRSSIAEMPQNSIKSGEPASAAASSSSSERRKDIIIHVFDENRNAKRDFYCKRQLLFREMKYFSTYLNDRNSTDHIDIDVHCDIEVFEWLMSYITRQRPSLEPRTAISILISSNFLQMLPLEDICLKYLHDHINEIVKVPIDMSCINKGLMIKLARLFSLEELGRIIDPRDKISSQIYFYKTCEVLGDDPRSVQLYCCMVCKKVYPKSLHKSIRCDKGRILVDYFGEITAAHTRDPNFNINEYIATIHSQDPSWKNIFWRIWSTVNHLKCQSCGSLFLCVDFQNCRKHLQRPLYSGSDSTVGTFGCCGATDYAFHPFHISEVGLRSILSRFGREEEDTNRDTRDSAGHIGSPYT